MKKSKKRNILFVEQNQDGTIGGSHYSLFYLVKALNRAKYNPIVIFYEKNSLFKSFEHIVETQLFEIPRGLNFESHNIILKFPYLVVRKSCNFIISVLIPFINSLIFLIKNNIFKL